mgnify:FL=1
MTSDSPKEAASATKSNNRRRGRSGRNQSNQATNPDAWDISQFKVEPAPGKVRFHDLDLPDSLMHAIADLGFEYCSPIQAEALPHSLSGHDVVGKAQTGTGKTAAFLIAMIDDFLRNPIEEKRYGGEPRALIIAPTRELVMQIAEDAKLLTKHCGLNVQVLVGGMDQHKQRQKLENDLVDILVATPGRLIDFATSSDVHLDQIEVLVIDEADRMLDMGFIPQVRRIVRMTPNNANRQTLFFSATFTPDVERLVERWLHEPVRIEIEPDNMAADSVDQRVYILSSDEKYGLLKRVIANENAESLIVFANRRDEVKRLYEKLKRDGIAVGILSGEVPQQKRVSTLERFKSGQTKVLVATDVAGRGIHVDNISHVVNYTLPEEPEDYVHRIGRTGRAGKTGVSISFACEDDSFRLEPIEKLLGRKLDCKVPPAEHSE